MSKPVVSLQARFFGLVAVILTIAVGSTILTVWHSAKPYLVAIHQDAVVELAEKRAQRLERIIADHRQFVEFIASYPDIIALVVGDVTSNEKFLDYLSVRDFPTALSRLSLFDVLEEEVLSFTADEAAQNGFPSFILSEISTEMLERADIRHKVIDYGEFSGNFHFLIAVPVVRNRSVEGVLAAEIIIEAESLFPPSQAVLATTITGREGALDGESNAVQRAYAPAGSTGFWVAVSPNPETAFDAGRDLIETVAIQVALVLLIPFGIFIIIGRKTLLSPHLALQRSEELLLQQKKELSELASIAENANDAIVVTDLSPKIMWVNPAFEALSGRSAVEVIGADPGAILLRGGADAATINQISEAIQKHEAVDCQIQIYRSDGKRYWINLSVAPLFNEANEAYGFMAVSRDITDMKAHHEALVQAKIDVENQALRDSLTDLPNRRALDQAISERLREKIGLMTMIRIDLDHFKYVNDTLGHEAGDHALCEAADILRSQIGPDDLAARVGGDEFVILLSPSGSVEDGQSLSRRLRELIRQPMAFEGKLMQMGASFGVAGDEDGFIEPVDVGVSADAALYVAKDAGRNRVALYTPEIHLEVVENRKLAAELRDGIRNREFEPWFQPQLDAKTFEICGAETLARWRNPRRGLLSPAEFLPVASQLSAVEEIDEIIFEEALKEVAAFQEDGVILPKLSFNVTALRLIDASILDMMDQHAPVGTTIAFEILESVLLEEKAADFNFHLDRLREAGIEIEIDDFGSGHASIIGLLRAGPNTMKIDQRLIQPLPESAAYRQMVRSIVEIGRSQNIRIIAEGVESAEHVRILRKLRVDYLQGFYFAEPMRGRELRDYVRNSSVSGFEDHKWRARP